jgi:Fructose-2,6-bisphosphatase
MSLKIYFLRHGETVYSKTGCFCGDLDPDLTPEGAKMAEQFAAIYAKLPWNAVYLSPMKRTIATAKPLCDSLGIEMQLRDGLKEIKYGNWEGKTLMICRQSATGSGHMGVGFSLEMTQETQDPAVGEQSVRSGVPG